MRRPRGRRAPLPALVAFASAAALLAACAAHQPASRPADVHALYEQRHAARLVPLLQQILRFPTRAEDKEGQAAQKAWLLRTAAALGFETRDAGPVLEIELPAGATGAPILGLIVHGDVQPVDAEGWTHPPFAGEVENGVVYGRGAADDKGAIIQALLAMASLRDSGLPRTHAIRLLVGSDEESGSSDFKEYLKTHAAPDYSLVLDSDFPVTIGEKAWTAIALTGLRDERGAPKDWSIEALEAGLAPSIVPDKAKLVLRWKEGEPRWAELIQQLQKKPMPPGTRVSFEQQQTRLTILVRGKSAHSGANIEGGRNATVALANLVDGELAASGWADLLGFAKLAGADLYGDTLGLPRPDLLWGGFTVNVATIKAVDPFWKNEQRPGALELVINVRRPPMLSGPRLRETLEAAATAFNQRAGASLKTSGFYADEPLSFDPGGKLVRRLLGAYERATGRAGGGRTSGGGTYAKRVPHSIAFGMWFAEAGPYPGHDTDEKVGIEWLQKGAHVLIEALSDLATGAKIEEPLSP